MAICKKCGTKKEDKRYHTKIRGIGTFCHMELFYIDENGNEQLVPEGQEDSFPKSYWKRVTDESAVEEIKEVDNSLVR